MLIPVFGQSTEDAVAAAREYIASRALNGFEIESDDLRLLLQVLSLPLDVVAELLSCDVGILKRKAQRWELSWKQSPPGAPSPVNPGGSRHNTRGARQFAKYSAEITRAQSYIEEHDLLNNKPTKEQYEYLYLTLGLPIPVLGHILKRPARIRFDLTEAGIRTRSNSEQKLHRYKVDFFKSWSPEMAWVLGLFYTDGHIDQTTARIASTDAELLSKFGAFVFTRFDIHSYLQPDGKNRISVLPIHHPEMLSDLRSLGLEERKSLTMQFPLVPAEYVRHFIRGCWDGDGGFTVSGGKLTAHYTCGSFPFISQIATELFKAGVTRRVLVHSTKTKSYAETRTEIAQLQREYGLNGPFPVNIYKRKNANAYDLRLGGRDQLVPLFDFLYKDVAQHMYLQRKYDLISEIL